MAETLAIQGGRPAVSSDPADQWQRPIDEEKELILGLIDKGIYAGGKSIVRDLEDKLREYLNCDFALSTDHGHTSIASAFYAAYLGPGDEFIVPTVGYLGGYAGGLHMGARPVFCDIDPKTLLMDPEDAEKKITSRTRLIHPVHMDGNVCDMDALEDLGRRRGIPIVVDACHAHACQWDGKKIANVGDISAFSLQGGPNPGGKPVAGGEGGIVATNNREMWERAYTYAQLHREPTAQMLERIGSFGPPYRMLDVELLGWKFRIHPFAAALATVSLKTLDYRNEKLTENWNKIAQGIEDLPGLEPQSSYEKAKRGFFGKYQIIYHPEELGGLPAKKFVKAMQAEGTPLKGPEIRPTRLPQQLEHLRSIYTQGYDLWGHGRGPLSGEWMGLPPFQGYREGDLPVAENLKDKVLFTKIIVEPERGFLDQFIAAFRKVTSNYEALL